VLLGMSLCVVGGSNGSDGSGSSDGSGGSTRHVDVLLGMYVCY
jgi:hypothetical protein